MPKYLIERELPTPMSRDELLAAAKRSSAAVGELGPDIQWLESYVTDEKIVCVYIASSEALIREHAFRGELPADRVVEITDTFDRTLAEQ